MSKRFLPAIALPDERPNARFDLHPAARASWDRAVTAKADDKVGVISILEVIGADWWTGEGVTARRVAAALRAIGDKPITVQINSPGGDFFEGIAIYNLLREHAQAVTVQIVGLAASAASVIAMAGDTIQIAKAGMIMIHNTQWVCAGTKEDMKAAFESMVAFDDVIARLFVDRTGNGEHEVKDWLAADTYMAGPLAIERGFADELLASDATTKTENKAARPFAYRLEDVLERYDIPRAEIRKALRELTDGMPGAAADAATPGAGDPKAADDGGVHLSLALARLKLARA